MSDTGTRSILITGCSSGIGLDAARRLATDGWQVFACCRKAEDCARLEAEGLRAPRLDYEDPDSIAAAVTEILAETGGRLDALYHNGAYAIPGALEDLPTDGLRAIFEANLFGWHELTRLVLPVMRAQTAGADQMHGRIVLVSSVLGFVPTKWRGAYVATKYALEGYGDVLRMEMRDVGIAVSLIEPGPITTRFRINATLQFERWIDWQASPRADAYRDRLIPWLRARPKPGKGFELPPAAVTDALIHALTARRPRRRYRVTVPTRAMAVAKRVLPEAALDWLLHRA
ncbi:SDR family NAD(P)-dependent oxidoreductase [Pseudoruegeria sp. SK021]|uniref:SDR family NAD(P)-dependent oxidoreductase n=1 Tax=Pseudoruegeria sp. SK021 TaxID=1933035 RepID=UPI000A25B8A5|nr:SDR family NAD(P)-dependent oxidoreductase [Pseudoruegeria sp. SK021]OSP55111.1 short-chain dehydrogenase [Pseudoruegeria sp. SK021]